MARLITWAQVFKAIKTLPETGTFYGVPRGGSIIAGLTGRAVDKPEDADYIVDDIFVTGNTMEKWKDLFPDKLFFPLFVKSKNPPVSDVDFHIDEYIIFPWEGSSEMEGEDLIQRVLEYIGEDCTRDGLIDTPSRVVRTFDTLYGGYKQDPKEVVTFFEDPSKEMVILKDIEFYSTCEHHMLPFFGKVHIGYIPNGKVVGISKLARLVEVYARRLQIQERMTTQIANCIVELIQPSGAMVVCEAQHLCMTSRGVEKQHSVMVTSAIRGAFEDKKLRAEFLSMIKG